MTTNNPNINLCSHWESVIADWLRKHSIKFETEKEFDNLINPRTRKKLRFDFYCPDNNLCIEFDGKHHYKTVKKFDWDKTDVNNQKFRDALKDAYCIQNKIWLLRIKYNQTHLIEKALCRIFIMNNVRVVVRQKNITMRLKNTGVKIPQPFKPKKCNHQFIRCSKHLYKCRICKKSEIK